jgi:hypothetical protein
MKEDKRIESILHAEIIGVSIEGVSNFDIADLKNVNLNGLDYSENMRLGKQVEKIVSALITASSNYKIIQENIQIIDGKITIGELDFIVKNMETDVMFHLELVYKFYLYDPNSAEVELEKWIGPNRKDSFIEKYNKLKTKQFPLLYKDQTKSYIAELNISELKQKLCFMASLFVPHDLIGEQFPLVNPKTIVGYWLSLIKFKHIQNEQTLFYLPTKQEWGMAPNSIKIWFSKNEIIDQIEETHQRQFSPLCWVQKQDNTYEQCFIVWW